MNAPLKYAAIIPGTKRNRFSVVTPFLKNPVDRLAKKAMGCADESFENLTADEAQKQAVKFNEWRKLNEERTKKKR